MKEQLLPRAEQLNAVKKYKEVVELLTDEVLQQHNKAELYAERAAALTELKEYDKAVADCDKAIEIDHFAYKPYFLRGYLWKVFNRRDKAIEDFSMAIRLHPEFADAWYQRGNVWLAKQDYDLALIDYNRALELNPVLANAYNNRGIAHDEKKEYDKAIEDYSKAIELNPLHLMALNNRGIAYSTKREFAKATADYNKAIELKPDYTDAYNNRGDVWHSQQDYDKAIEDYSRAIGLNPDYAVGYRNRAQAHYDKGDYMNALADIDRSLELEPTNLTAQFLRDRTRTMLGQTVVPGRRTADESFYLFVKAVEHLTDTEQREILLASNRIMDTAVKKIRAHALRTNDEMVAHYTKLPVADVLVSGNDTRLRYYNAVYMNDPEEGMVLLDALRDPDIRRAFSNGFEKGESNIYLGSFLPVDRSDDLVMWRTYGKDENNIDAAGCCIVVDSALFERSSDVLNPDMRRTEKNGTGAINPQSLYRVLYYNKHRDDYAGEGAEKLKEDMEELRISLQELLRLKANHPSDKKDIAIDKIVYHIISELRYFFKSADYSFENELRVIQFAPLDSDTVQVDERAMPKKLFIHSSKTVQSHINRIVLGPKVSHPERWIYLEAVLKKKIRGHNMKLHKSECRYQ